MATALTDSARKLQWELTQCETAVAEVKAGIIARAEPDVVRTKFRSCQTAMMCLGRSLALDRRFRSRLPSDKREQALDMLRQGAKPIELKRQLGIDNNTVRRLRHRELGDNRNLNRVCKLNADQVAKIRSTGRATTRRTLAEKFNVSMSLISKIRNGRGPYRREAAVSASPIQQTTVVKRENMERPAKRNIVANDISSIGELTLKFSRPLMESLMEMAELTSPKTPGIPEIQSYVIALVEAQIADFRCRRIPADFLHNDKTPVPDVGDIKPRGKLSDDNKKRIIEQHDAGMKIPELATRWHVGTSSIRRALQGAKKRALPAPEIVQKILHLNAQKYNEHDEFIGVQAIAETLHLPESVVSAVLSNHKPVTPSTTAIYGRPPRPGGWDRHYLSNGGTNGNQTQR